MDKQYQLFLETAVIAAKKAGEIIMANVGKIESFDVAVKSASDYVTKVDKAAEEVIISTIKEKFPIHSILAEETGRGEFTSDYLWIIDPLDGTTNFIHSFPAFATSIGLQYKKELIVGVVFDPWKNELFTAIKGKGSFLNGVSITVSAGNEFKDALLATGFPFRAKEYIDPYLRLFKNLFNQVGEIRRAGSAALDLAYLACGRFDGFFEIGLKPWDIAAGAILIKEAGGQIGDFSGGNDFLQTGNVLAATATHYQAIVKEAKIVFKGIIDK